MGTTETPKVDKPPSILNVLASAYGENRPLALAFNVSAIQKQLSYIKTFIEDCNETLEEISHVQKFSGTDLVDITVSIAETLVELEESLDEAEQELQYSIACFDCLVEQVSELQQLAI